MNRIISMFATLAVLCLAIPAIAHEGHQAAGEKVAK